MRLNHSDGSESFIMKNMNVSICYKTPLVALWTGSVREVQWPMIHAEVISARTLMCVD